MAIIVAFCWALSLGGDPCSLTFLLIDAEKRGDGAGKLTFHHSAELFLPPLQPDSKTEDSQMMILHIFEKIEDVLLLSVVCYK